VGEAPRAGSARRSPHPLPEPLAATLRRAHSAERVAVGADRVPAFRLTRTLLSAAREAGYRSSQLAECLGLSVSTVEARRAADGWLAAEVFAEVAGVPVESVRGWAADGLLPSAPPGDVDGDHYLASELVRALVASSRRAWRGSG
jgi:hypothetical protein